MEWDLKSGRVQGGICSLLSPHTHSFNIKSVNMYSTCTNYLFVSISFVVGRHPIPIEMNDV
jgi:hypothetical protein